MPKKHAKSKFQMVWVTGLVGLDGKVSVRQVSADVAENTVKFIDETPPETGYRCRVPKAEVGVTRAEALDILAASLMKKRLELVREVAAIDVHCATIAEMKEEGQWQPL